jgi:hypothetical protein
VPSRIGGGFNRYAAPGGIDAGNRERYATDGGIDVFVRGPGIHPEARLKELTMNIKTRSVLAGVGGLFCGAIASYFVPGPTYVRALVAAGVCAVVIVVFLVVTSWAAS